MKKFYLVITCLLFIIIGIVALLKVSKLYDYTKLNEKQKEVTKQKITIEELNNEISNYEELMNDGNGEFDWKQMLEMIEKYS